jgi:hypothetical protein
MYGADIEGGSASTAEEPSADAPALEKAAEILAEEAAASFSRSLRMSSETPYVRRVISGPFE